MTQCACVCPCNNAFNHYVNAWSRTMLHIILEWSSDNFKESRRFLFHFFSFFSQKFGIRTQFKCPNSGVRRGFGFWTKRSSIFCLISLQFPWDQSDSRTKIHISMHRTRWYKSFETKELFVDFRDLRRKKVEFWGVETLAEPQNRPKHLIFSKNTPNVYKRSPFLDLFETSSS